MASKTRWPLELCIRIRGPVLVALSWSGAFMASIARCRRELCIRIRGPILVALSWSGALHGQISQMPNETIYPLQHPNNLIMAVMLSIPSPTRCTLFPSFPPYFFFIDYHHLWHWLFFFLFIGCSWLIPVHLLFLYLKCYSLLSQALFPFFFSQLILHVIIYIFMFFID